MSFTAWQTVEGEGMDFDEIIYEKKTHEELGGGIARITINKPARECLLNYSWPGNIRELRNALEQSVILGDGKKITPSDLPPEIGRKGRGKMIFRLKPLAEMEKQYIDHVLRFTRWNKSRASEILGITRPTHSL